MKIAFSPEAEGDGSPEWLLNTALSTVRAEWLLNTANMGIDATAIAFDIIKKDGTRVEGAQLHSVGVGGDLLFSQWEDKDELFIVTMDDIDTLVYC